MEDLFIRRHLMKTFSFHQVRAESLQLVILERNCHFS